jgi:hypothetical protein
MEFGRYKMTIQKYPADSNITRPDLTEDIIIETSGSATTFFRNNYVKSGNYLIESSKNSAIIVSGAGINLVASTSPQIVNASSSGSIAVSAYTKPVTPTSRTIPSSGTTFYGAIYPSPDKIWTMSSGGTASIVVYSTDSITWSNSTTPVAAWWSSSVYGGGSYVAISFGFSHAVSSTDGITWTQRTLPVSASWNTVVFVTGDLNIPQGFYAVAGGGTSYAVYSSNGTTWNLRNLPVNGSWKPLLYDGVRLISINAAGSQVATSTNGTNWTNIGNMPFTPTSPNLWNSIDYDGVTYVSTHAQASSNPGSLYATSTDGITWTQRTMPSTQSWSRSVYGAGYFFASTLDSSFALSTDGITWSLRNVPFSGIGAQVNYYDRLNSFFRAASASGSAPDNLLISTQSPLPDGEIIFGMYEV